MRSPFTKPVDEAPAIAEAKSTDAPKAARQRRVLPIHPILFAVFPLLALYARNMDQVPLAQVFRPLGMALAATTALWVILTLLIRDVRKTAIAVSVLILAFSSYGHLLNVLPQPLHWIVAPVCIAGVSALLFGLVKTRKQLLDLTSVLNLTSIVLLTPSSWLIASNFWHASQPGVHAGAHVASVSQPEQKHAVSTLRPRRAPISVSSADLPDIYYIILDAYGRADSLKTFYEYDNTPFIKELEKRGFYIAKQSRANYNQTPLCLASSLNFSYLDGLAASVGPSGSLDACRRILDDNKVAAYLNKQGYHYVYVGSGVDEVKVETADLALNDEPDIPLFEEQAESLMRPGIVTPEQLSRYDQHRKRLLGVFGGLKTVARLPYTKFVFAHLLAPHPPFVFGSDGHAVYPKGALNFADGSWLLRNISREQYISGYIAQLQYVNKRTLEAVDTILSQSRRRPIIIIQGDHGSRMNLDWDSVEKTELREPFSILNAYYVPKKLRNDLYDTITPVNSFRILLTDLFGAKLRRLPDRSFYSTADQPYGFIEVTDRLARRGTSVRSASTTSSPQQALSGTAR